MSSTDFTPKLYYFDIPGKGEAIRLSCAYAHFPLVDVRPSREEFIQMKEVRFSYDQTFKL